MTHAEVVTRAERWLRVTKRCAIVLADVRCTAVYEQPDAIAWRNGGRSIVVECKVSRSDFLRDAHKWFRREPEQGMGQERWVAVPAGLVDAQELPERWGLVEFDGRSARILRKPVPFTEYNHDAERALLITALRRATEGWGRRMFGEIAPAAPDGDPHPSFARVIRDLRLENMRLRTELMRLQRGAA